jgi:heme-degrading monooxygenase HmoA
MPARISNPMTSPSWRSNGRREAIPACQSNKTCEDAMFLRMVTYTIREAELLPMARTYERYIIPALRSTAGCVFAAVIQNIDNAGECISLTMWRSQAESAEYESSGLYSQLVNGIRPYFTEATEWKVQLNEEYLLETVPIQIEPEVVGYSDPVTNPDEISRLKAKPFAVQIVTVSVQEGHGEEFERIFSSEIRQMYRSHKGFIDLILLRQNREYHSISFWDETVDITSSSDIHSITQLVKSIYSVLPSFVQWRLTHRGAVHTSASSEDVRATIHRCLAAEWFTV